MSRQKITVDQAIATLGSMADAFLINSLLLKAASPHNQALPFLQIHTLELVAKCALMHIEQKLEPDLLSHKVREIFRKITKQKPEFAVRLPSANSFARYRTVFVVDDGTEKNITLPPPVILDEYELAYFIENITELKYGFNRKFELTSSLQMSSPQINSTWRILVASTRAIYSNEALNSAALASGLKVFGNNDTTLQDLKVYLGIT